MTVDSGQKYQERLEADSNITCQLKWRDKPNRVHDEMDIPVVKEVMHVSSYPLLEYIGF